MQGIMTDLRWLGTVTLLAVLLAVVTLIGGADHSFAATFNPTGAACLDNETTPAKCDGDSAPGAVSGITTAFNLPKGDANFSAVISFYPPEWFIANGNDIPDGAMVGKLTAGATLGLIGGACDGALTPTFPLMDATINPSSQVTFDNGFKDADSDGVADAVTKYPDFLARSFPGQTFRARLYGQAVVGGVNVSLNFIIFNPGDLIKDITPDPKLGYPSVTVLQNIGDPDIVPASSAISDFCSPLTSDTTTYGTTQDNPKTAANEGGKEYRKNPTTAGTYTFVTYAASLRDADGDGLENNLDTCPFNPDTWDPRVGQWGTVQPGDSDGDRIPDTCDATPNDAYPSIDADTPQKDFYLNTGDNCPQVANGISTNGHVIGPNNQKDTDSDSIGDECDILGAGGIGKGPSVADGEVLKLCGVQAIQVGGGGTPDTKVLNRIPCGAGVADATPTPTPPPDADGDGVPDSADKCASTPAGTSVNADGCSAKQIKDLAEKALGTLTSGLSLATGLANVTVGSSTVLAAGFADDAGKAVAGAAVTFKIDQQPGSDANLEGQAQVTKTTDAQGVATATLNAGSKPGAIVVSAAAQGKTKTVTVNVAAPAAVVVNPPDGGIGSLAPVAGSVPAWAAFVTAAGGIGMLIGIGTLASRRLTARRRRD